MILETPKAFLNFEFSIIHVLPKSITDKEAINNENLYKKKYNSKEFGLNKN